MHAITILTNWLLETTWQVALLAIAVALLQLLLKRWLSPAARFALWMIVAARLMLPLLPSSPWSLYSLAKSPVVGTEPKVERTRAPLGSPQAQRAGILEPRESVLTQPWVEGDPFQKSPERAKQATLDHHTLPTQTPAPPTSTAARTPQSLTPPQSLALLLDWRTTLLTIWLAGATLLLTRLIIQSLRLTQLRNQTTEIGREGPVQICESPTIRSPALCGILRPTILLPAGLSQTLSPQQYRLILAHEMAHYLRRDHWTNLLLRILQAIHWFNPVVYIINTRCRLERELACDEAVLRQANANDRQLYGSTLLTLASSLAGGRWPEPVLAMAEGKRHLKYRIGSIATGSAGRRRPALLGITLCTALAFVGLTRAQMPAPSPTTPKANPAPAPATQPAALTSLTASDLPALEKAIPEFRLDGVSLEDALDQIRSLSGMNVMVDWATLNAAGITRTAPVTIRMRDVTVAKALSAVLDTLSTGPHQRVRYTAGDGAITISTQDWFVRHHLVTRVYDVSDLVLQMPSASHGTGAPTTSNSSRRPQLEGIGSLVEQTVAADSWKSAGGWGSIHTSPRGQDLVITQTPEIHQQVQNLLSQLRETLAVQVSIQCRFLSVDPAQLPADLKRLLEQTFGKSQSQSVFLTREQVSQLIAAAQNVPDASLVTAPRVTVLNGGEARVVAQQATSYVAAYNAHVDTHGETDYRPVLDRVQEGVVLPLRANVSADRKAVTLWLRPTFSTLTDLAPQPWSGNTAANQHLTIQKPNVELRELETLASIPDQQTLLMGGFATHPTTAPSTQPSAGDKWQTIFVLVSPTIIDARPKEH